MDARRCDLPEQVVAVVVEKNLGDRFGDLTRDARKPTGALAWRRAGVIGEIPECLRRPPRRTRLETGQVGGWYRGRRDLR